MLFEKKKINITFTDAEKEILMQAYRIVDSLSNYMNKEKCDTLTDQYGSSWTLGKEIFYTKTFLENAFSSEVGEWELE